MKKVFVPMHPHNIELILSGKKYTTLRDYKSAWKIGLIAGEEGFTTWKEQTFLISCRGELTVDESGGKESMWVSEGFHITGEPLFKSTEKWLNGKGKLWVYDIRKI